MNRVVFLVSPRQNVFFTEVADALAAELTALGVPTATTGRPEEVVDGDVPVLIPPHEWWAVEGDVLPAELVARAVFVSAEQPGTWFFDRDVQLARHAGAVFDVNPSAVRAYRASGVDAEHLQLGWTDRWVHQAPASRDVDVLFLGCATDHRLRVLAGLADVLDPRRSHLLLSDNSAPNTGSSSSFAAGADKWALLARSRVLLNVHQDRLPYFEWLRVVQAIANGCVVVSERARDHAPLVAGEHLLFGAAASLPYLVEALLDDEPRRAAMADRAAAFLAEQLPLSTAAHALAERAEALAAPGAVGHASLPPLPAAVPPPPPPPPRDASDALLRAAIKDVRLDFLELRRALTRVLAQQAAGAPVPAVTDDARSPAWASGRGRVSVLLTVYNYAHHVHEALDSLAAASYRDIEVVVVDDGSVDHSADAVRQWSDRHPWLPLILVRHPVNRGLPHARNTATDYARGEFAFVLDADNELLPRGLQRLVGALDGDPDAAFAYGMLQRHAGRDPVGLMCTHPWDPGRLRHGNYIDAMALIRLETLRALGGYATDARLHGWEDYDLWCRIAEGGGRAAFVPEIVGRYRSSPHSMLSLTDLSWDAARALLAVRCPRVFAAAVPVPA